MVYLENFTLWIHWFITIISNITIKTMFLTLWIWKTFYFISQIIRFYCIHGIHFSFHFSWYIPIKQVTHLHISSITLQWLFPISSKTWWKNYFLLHQINPLLYIMFNSIASIQYYHDKKFQHISIQKTAIWKVNSNRFFLLSKLIPIKFKHSQYHSKIRKCKKKKKCFAFQSEL